MTEPKSVLNILDECFYLAQISPASIKECMTQLVKIILFPERELNAQTRSSSCQPFFSLTSTQDCSGVSLICDEQTLSKFPKDSLNQGIPLRGIQIYQGTEALSKKKRIFYF